MFIKQIAALIVTTAALNCVVAGPASAQYVNSGAMSAGTQTQGLDGQKLPSNYAGDGAGYVQSSNGAQASYTQAGQSYNGQGTQKKYPWWTKLWHNRLFNVGVGGDGGYEMPNNGYQNSGATGGSGSTGAAGSY
jgi:hypothetical protein